MKKHVRILILDNDKYTTHLMERELSGRFPDSVVVVFHAAQRALEELEQNRYDVAVIDYETAGCKDSNQFAAGKETEQEGTRFLKCVRDRSRFLPMIVLTSVNGPSEGTVSARSLSIEGAGAVHCLVREDGFHTSLPALIDRALVRRTFERSGFVPGWDTVTEADYPSIDAVAGRLSHEVNNPLMTILGMTELLLDDSGEKDEGFVKKLRVIRKSAQRIAVALSRLSSGASPNAEIAAAADLEKP